MIGKLLCWAGLHAWLEFEEGDNENIMLWKGCKRCKEVTGIRISKKTYKAFKDKIDNSKWPDGVPKVMP